MKIEVFSAKRRLFTPHGTHVEVSWSWRSKVNGRITASAHGYSRRRDAVRAALNHAISLVKIAETWALVSHGMRERMRSRIRAAIKVIE